MKTKQLTILLALMFSVVSLETKADVRLASPFQEHMVLQQNKPITVWGWADSGEKVSVTVNNNTVSTITAPDGRWLVSIPAMKYGGPYKMSVTGENAINFNDIYIGEVWLCSGQSNMVMTVAREKQSWCGVYNEAHEVANANYPLIRVLTVNFDLSDTPLDTCSGLWEVVSPKTVGHMSAPGYFFARELYKKYKMPIGLIVTGYGASTVEAWTSKDVQAKNDRLKYLIDKYETACEDYDCGHAMGRYQVALANWNNANGVLQKEEQSSAVRSQDVTAPKSTSKKPGAPRNPHRDQHSPYVLWNAMVNPLVPYTIRGAIWYQGESNGGTANIYREQMEVMIKDWRAKWNMGDFPFYYVQLANRGDIETVPAKGGQDALVREAQLQNLWMRNTGMVVAIDNANPENPSDVHPKNKQEIGRRFALIARANVYGEKNIVYSGPIYKSMEIEAGKIRVVFDHIGGGLIAKDGKLEGFAIAGSDGKFVWADARIDGNSVIVSSPEITQPAIVNYGFGRNPVTSLYNKEGLPASPFRTNDK